MMKTVVGIGEALWDVLPTGKKIGGAPANFAYNVSQFGLRGVAVSAIADDDLGRELIEKFNEHSLEYYLPVVSQPTGSVQVTLDCKGVPTYEIAENVAWDNIPFDSKVEELSRTADVVCFGSLAQRSDVSRKTIGRFIENLPKAAMKIFDVNLRQNFFTKQIIEESLKVCNVLKINDEEIEVVKEMLGIESQIDYTTACREIIKRYDLRLVILTCGATGSYVVSSDEVNFEPTPHIKLADTVGAGDSFTAAFCAAQLSELSLKDSHKLAVHTAAYVCSCYGAMTVLPEELKLILQR